MSNYSSRDQIQTLGYDLLKPFQVGDYTGMVWAGTYQSPAHAKHNAETGDWIVITQGQNKGQYYEVGTHI